MFSNDAMRWAVGAEPAMMAVTDLGSFFTSGELTSPTWTGVKRRSQRPGIGRG